MAENVDFFGIKNTIGQREVRYDIIYAVKVKK